MWQQVPMIKMDGFPLDGFTTKTFSETMRKCSHVFKHKG